MVYRAAGNLVADAFVDRQAFAGDSAFVECTAAFDNRAVDGDGGTAFDDEHVACNNFCQQNLSLQAVTLNECCFRRQVHERLDGVGGVAFGTRLHKFADRDERQDNGAGFKVKRVGELGD